LGLRYPKDELQALSDFDLALLVLVRLHHEDGGITAYEIVRLNNQGTAGLLGRSQASAYARLRVLAEKGFVTAEQVPGKRGREATRYALTRKGDEALLVWLDTSIARLPALDDSEVFVLIRAARLPGAEKPVLKALQQVSWEIEDWRAQLDTEEKLLRREGIWTVSPAHRLEISLMRKLLDAYYGWLEEVERELGNPEARA